MATASIPASLIQRANGSLWDRIPPKKPGNAKAAVISAPTRRDAGGWSDARGLTLGAGQEKNVTPVDPETMMSPEDPKHGINPARAAALAEQKVLADLAARCLAGDSVAWEKLVAGQQRRVYGICYRFTGSPTEAEDMAQDVFLKMYRNLGNFDPSKGGFNTWLTTLTRNLLVDNYRRTRMDRVSDSLDETFDGEDDGPTKAERLMDGGKSQEQHVAGLELKAQIQAALAQVSPELREAVILRDLEDMDYKEIAEVLGVPQGTVKSRISRGRSELARLLKRIEGQVM